jgi:hypothetical protein
LTTVALAKVVAKEDFLCKMLLKTGAQNTKIFLYNDLL